MYDPSHHSFGPAAASDGIEPARLLSHHTHLVPGQLLVTEYAFEVPKDYNNPSSGSIRLFARSVTKREVPIIPLSSADFYHYAQKPWFVYLEGGPGFGNREPQESPITRFVLNRGYQMLFLDYRGTGLSATITADTLELQGGPQEQADYLKLFRQDNNVRDLEAVRRCLTEDYPAEKKQWSIFGQSFGGFVSLTYLSNKFPGDIELVRNLATHIGTSPKGIDLPAGGRLTVRRLLTVGHMFGLHGGVDTVHSLLLRMKSDLDQFKFFTRPTLTQIEQHMLPFDIAPIYAILHEAIYCYKKGLRSDWAANRIGQKLSEFAWLSDRPPGFNSEAFEKTTLYFSGEMIYPFMFDVYPELKRMKQAAHILAHYDEWDNLYDEDQLARNEVPIYAASFIDDMYVDCDLARDTVRKVQGVKVFETNSMYHNAVRARPEEVLPQLFRLRDDTID
ncbi:putative proline iminopeptidase protein [Phaeoacremonium minimum UCRPA7]|uniref:Putative proline iminopeptidase protein n=1 Tax=Phaeoacremonium minimum (strain UCR-PA7) TaxID=1286976 RepID=R8BFA8_PHAM7|nr:putative proline iminopeptidase protein [Phaeoacremonium minimum UCRPA7]EON97985.1 putative proline iminopeptidase protein [Phaeoacremonium minimum UCRPA7]